MVRFQSLIKKILFIGVYFGVTLPSHAATVWMGLSQMPGLSGPGVKLAMDKIDTAADDFLYVTRIEAGQFANPVARFPQQSLPTGERVITYKIGPNYSFLQIISSNKRQLFVRTVHHGDQSKTIAPSQYAPLPFADFERLLDVRTNEDRALEVIAQISSTQIVKVTLPLAGTKASSIQNYRPFALDKAEDERLVYARAALGGADVISVTKETGVFHLWVPEMGHKGSVNKTHRGPPLQNFDINGATFADIAPDGLVGLFNIQELDDVTYWQFPYNGPEWEPRPTCAEIVVSKRVN